MINKSRLVSYLMSFLFAISYVGTTSAAWQIVPDRAPVDGWSGVASNGEVTAAITQLGTIMTSTDYQNWIVREEYLPNLSGGGALE